MKPPTYTVTHVAEHVLRLPRPITAPVEAAEAVRPAFAGAGQREAFVVLLLNGRHSPLAAELVSIGTLNASLVHPREVFRRAIARGAASIIIAHNHPSGDPEPSEEDIAMAKRLSAAGDILGIELLDSLVLVEGSMTSMQARGLMGTKP